MADERRVLTFVNTCVAVCSSCFNTTVLVTTEFQHKETKSVEEILVETANHPVKACEREKVAIKNNNHSLYSAESWGGQ